MLLSSLRGTRITRTPRVYIGTAHHVSSEYTTLHTIITCSSCVCVYTEVQSYYFISSSRVIDFSKTKVRTIGENYVIILLIHVYMEPVVEP